MRIGNGSGAVQGTQRLLPETSIASKSRMKMALYQSSTGRWAISKAIKRGGGEDSGPPGATRSR